MSLLIGIDEAGLGPNLGPLVVACSVWEVPDDPREFDFWRIFQPVLTNQPTRNDTRLHIADSKEVHSPAHGVGALESGLFAAFGLLNSSPPKTFRELVQHTTGERTLGDQLPEPWFAESDLKLPSAIDELPHAAIDAWRDLCKIHRVRLRHLIADVVSVPRFNQLVEAANNKSIAVSRISFELLSRVWSPDETQATFIVGDKHGGRNRYAPLLTEMFPGPMFQTVHESADASQYRVGISELRFQPRAELYGPVAIASMLAKYLRELSMDLFNRFWCGHLPDLKPTKGYPTDARRFREAIAATQKSLGIADDVLWRSR